MSFAGYIGQTPSALTREQVEAGDFDRVQIISLIESLAQQALIIDQLKREGAALAAGSCESPYGDDYGNKRCKTIDELRAECRRIECLNAQQAQEVESARELNRIAAVALSDKEQELDRQVDKHLKLLNERNGLIEELAAMTTERDEWQKRYQLAHTDQVQTEAVFNDAVQDIKQLQSTLTVREAELARLKEIPAGLDAVTRMYKTERDCPRQDAARLREALGALMPIAEEWCCPEDENEVAAIEQAKAALKGA